MTDEIRSILIKHFQKGQYLKIIALCTELIEDNKTDFELYGARSFAYLSLEDYGNAKTDSEKSILLNEKYIKGYCTYLQCSYYLMDHLSVISTSKKLFELDSEDKYYYLTGLSYYYIGENIEAMKYLTLSIEKENCKYLLPLRAKLYYFSGCKLNGINDIEEYLKTNIDGNNDILKIEEINKAQNDLYTKELYGNILSEDDLINKLYYINYSMKACYLNNLVYILKFTNNEYYIGETVDFKKRLIQHQKKFKDICSIFIKVVEKDQLLIQETKTIALFELYNFRIRNIRQLNFNTIFNYENQYKWLNNNNYNFVSGTLYTNENDISYTERYRKIRNQVYYNEFISLAAYYIKKYIPNYIASEYNYWCLTCLPKHLIGSGCISRININTVPVISFFWVENTLKIMLIVSKLPFIEKIHNNKHIFELFHEFKSIIITCDDNFEATECDEISIEIDANEFIDLLSNEVINKSIRMLNLRMMNRAGAGFDWKRKVSHSSELTKEIYKIINLTIAST